MLGTIYNAEHIAMRKDAIELLNDYASYVNNVINIECDDNIKEATIDYKRGVCLTILKEMIRLESILSCTAEGALLAYTRYLKDNIKIMMSKL